MKASPRFARGEATLSIPISIPRQIIAQLVYYIMVAKKFKNH